MTEKKRDSSKVGLVWYRGSLRLRDNAALAAALSENEQVRCLYVLDDHYLKSDDIGAARVNFLLESLRELSEVMEKHGGQLIVRRSRQAAEECVKAAKQAGAGRIYFNEDYLPYPKERDRKVEKLASEAGIEVSQYRDILLADPDRVRTEEGNPYTVFTPFKNRWEGQLKTPEEYEITPHLSKLKGEAIDSDELPTLKELGHHLKQEVLPVGEKAAYARLKEFTSNGLEHYHQDRDAAADPNSTSKLSAHLKWGTVSLRDCYREARKAGGPGAAKWIDELAWREFYYGIVHHFPHVMTGPMLAEYENFPWDDNQDHIDAWKAGMTGHPFVDAGMRQLNATGWMHNRLRQVVASFLIKDLCINWQVGERYFMQQLADGDWPSNNGGWQWVSGSGTDPRRATRIFNPTLQMERYDPQLEYVRQWVPEYGTSRYPKQIITHEAGREEYLKRFESTAASREAIRSERKEAAAEKKKALKKRKGEQSTLF